MSYGWGGIDEPDDGVLIGTPLYVGVLSDLTAWSKHLAMISVAVALLTFLVMLVKTSPCIDTGHQSYSVDAVKQYEAAFLEPE